MRLPVITLVALLLCSAPAFSITDINFDKFVKSREVIDTFYFKNNAEALTKVERDRLKSIVNELKSLQQNGRMIRVEGFSSPDGDQERNFKLSFYRARFVADMIQERGLPAEITMTGYGDLRAGNKDFSRERRVEIASYAKPGGMKRIQLADDEVQNPEKINSKNDIRENVRRIDSYRVDQAIRSRVEHKNRGLADDSEGKGFPDLSQFDVDYDIDLEKGYTLWRKSVDPEYAMQLAKMAPRPTDVNAGLSKVRPINAPGGPQKQFGKVKPVALPVGLERKYSEIQPVESEEIQRGYSQTQPVESEEVQRGYSQTQPAESEEVQRGYSQTQPAIPADAPELSMLEPPPIDALMIEQAIMEKIGVAALEPSGEVSQISVKYQSEDTSN